MSLSHLLIVDDDDVSNYLTGLWLEPRQLCQKVSFATNGKEAAELFNQFNQKGEFPELILLDINMPLMNGFDFLDWYEKSGLTGSTKFSMYTTSIRTQDREKAGKYKDVIEFIEKPIDNQSLKILREKIQI